MLLAASASAYSAPKTVLVLGDSLSAEYGLNRGSGWVALLEKKLKAERISAKIVNASISGETTSGGRARLPALIRQHKPSVVVIELGANDGLRGQSLSQMKHNITAMVTKAKNGDARVLLVGVQLPPNYGGTYAGNFQRVYREVAREQKVALVMDMLDGIATNAALMHQDRIHPNARAQGNILDNVWPALLPMLN